VSSLLEMDWAAKWRKFRAALPTNKPPIPPPPGAPAEKQLPKDEY